MSGPFAPRRTRARANSSTSDHDLPRSSLTSSVSHPVSRPRKKVKPRHSWGIGGPPPSGFSRRQSMDGQEDEAVSVKVEEEAVGSSSELAIEQSKSDSPSRDDFPDAKEDRLRRVRAPPRRYSDEVSTSAPSLSSPNVKLNPSSTSASIAHPSTPRPRHLSNLSPCSTPTSSPARRSFSLQSTRSPAKSVSTSASPPPPPAPTRGSSRKRASTTNLSPIKDISSLPSPPAAQTTRASPRKKPYALVLVNATPSPSRSPSLSPALSSLSSASTATMSRNSSSSPSLSPPPPLSDEEEELPSQTFERARLIAIPPSPTPRAPRKPPRDRSVNLDPAQIPLPPSPAKVSTPVASKGRKPPTHREPPPIIACSPSSSSSPAPAPPKKKKPPSKRKPKKKKKSQARQRRSPSPDGDPDPWRVRVSLLGSGIIKVLGMIVEEEEPEEEEWERSEGGSGCGGGGGEWEDVTEEVLAAVEGREGGGGTRWLLGWESGTGLEREMEQMGVLPGGSRPGGAEDEGATREKETTTEEV